ncbi:hypothetical protein [Natronococcus wangiae]|uniref:hypothetical protein n=1 Tax=Natronococcus wangiae TaxID=3068275 RepID=UPI00273FCC96|nr:hypothetical protein [Natronococcus sp. AD5]
MSFRMLLGWALKIIFGWVVFLFAVITAMALFMAGYMISGIIALAMGMVGVLYAEYHRGKQGERIHDGKNTHR